MFPSPGTDCDRGGTPKGCDSPADVPYAVPAGVGPRIKSPAVVPHGDVQGAVRRRYHAHVRPRGTPNAGRCL